MAPNTYNSTLNNMIPIQRSSSFGSDNSHPDSPSSNNSTTTNNNNNRPLEPAVLVYHESARDIVFRDQIRRADKYNSNNNSKKNNSTRKSTGGMMNLPGGGVRLSGLISRDTSRLSDVIDTNDNTFNSFDTNHSNNSHTSNSPRTSKVVIANYQPVIEPLPLLELTQHDTFDALLVSDSGRSTCDSSSLSDDERYVVELLKNEKAVVKTIKNNEWTSFLHRFKQPKNIHNTRYCKEHLDIPPHDDIYRFNSFITSTSLLPSMGYKMRCYGSTKEYTTGVIFALPSSYKNESEEQEKTKTWCWPSGYSAKTEYNIDNRGRLINGRQEALVSFEQLRANNNTYLTKQDYEINGHLVKGGLHVVPYNEVYIRVGGPAITVTEDKGGSVEKAKGERNLNNHRSLDKGIGLPIGLFVRTSTYGHLVSLLRTRARCTSILGSRNMKDIPLLLITPENGIHVLTQDLQKKLLKIVSHNLNPFQNSNIAYKTTLNNALAPGNEQYLQQKFEELIDLDSNHIRNILTPEECAKIAGGFGATDDSVANLLMECVNVAEEAETAEDDGSSEGSNNNGSNNIRSRTTALQDVVNEGLEAAVRSGDYHTSRQLLILYTLVASRSHQQKARGDNNDDDGKANATNSGKDKQKIDNATKRLSTLDMIIASKNGKRNGMVNNTHRNSTGNATLSTNLYSPPPPPPPLDTDRLRSATNSDGLLAVLGAAEVLKSMQDGGAKKRIQEAALAIEEWVEHGESSVAFRLASWREQRAAQNDLKINMSDNSDFLAFVSSKAITNRKNFARQLRKVVDSTNTEDVSFLESIHNIVSQMHSPCLRLELLQYVLGLDNRYSVAHVARSVELAATCMNISAQQTTVE